MGRKNWPSWLKGGIIGVFILIFIFLITNFLPTGNLKNQIFVLFIFLPAFPFFSFGGINILPFIVLTLEYFIIGAIIGWLIWKFKK